MTVRLLWVLVAISAFAVPVAAQTPPPVEAFGRLPAVADAAISADGRRLALATSQPNGEEALVIVNLDQMSDRTGYAMRERQQLRAVGWADSERVTFLISQTYQPNEVLPDNVRFLGHPRRVDYWRWGAINTSTGRIRSLTTDEDNEWADTGADLVTPIDGEPGQGRLLGYSRDDFRRIAVVFRVNLDTGYTQQFPVHDVNQDTKDFVIDRAGRAVARLDADRESNRWRLFVYDGETPRLLLEDVSRYGEPLSISGLLPDGRLVAEDTNEAGFTTLYAINRRTGERQALHELPNADVGRALTDPWTREVVGVTWTNVETEEFYFEPDLRQVREALVSAGNLSAFRIVSWSQDRSRFLIYAENGLDGGAYYLFEPATSTLRALAARYPDLIQANLGERQAITYRARDGTRIPAYLTLPEGAERRNLPLVLLPHGGPHVRETMDFDWWASFLASRGYVVLQPNYRGSSGYGEAWEDAGRRQWGGLMQTDIEDGVVALARTGMIDANRVCIVGASYGGYAALAGATLTPDRYRCAVSVAGLSDLELFLDRRQMQSGGDDTISSDWWRASIGDRQEDRARIRSVSPVHLAERVQIPVLLIHGTDDTVVPIEQSRRMLDALQDAHKQVQFVELRGDDHWLSDASTRIQMLREIEAFLAQNLE